MLAGLRQNERYFPMIDGTCCTCTTGRDAPVSQTETVVGSGARHSGAMPCILRIGGIDRPDLALIAKQSEAGQKTSRIKAKLDKFRSGLLPRQQQAAWIARIDHVPATCGTPKPESTLWLNRAGRVALGRSLERDRSMGPVAGVHPEKRQRVVTGFSPDGLTCRTTTAGICKMNDQGGGRAGPAVADRYLCHAGAARFR